MLLLLPLSYFSCTASRPFRATGFHPHKTLLTSAAAAAATTAATASCSSQVLGFVFAGANVARLLVPLRFGAALALAPWVDDNIMSKFKGAAGQEE